MKLHFHRALLVGASALALAACGDAPPPPPPAAAAKPAAKKKEEAAAAPVMVASQVDYVYNAMNKRDPFRGLLIEKVAGPNQQTNESCSDPLCQYDVDDLKLVAVVSGDANPLAMVEDRMGIGHMVRRNTPIGKQGGKVTQVLRDCIVVTSYVSGGADGKPQINKQNMCVKTDTKSAPAFDLTKNKEFIP